MVDSELDLLHRSWMRALKARNLAVKTLRTYGDSPNAPRARHRVDPLPGVAAVLHVGGAKAGQALDRHLRARAKHRRSFEQAVARPHACRGPDPHVERSVHELFGRGMMTDTCVAAN